MKRVSKYKAFRMERGTEGKYPGLPGAEGAPGMRNFQC